MDLDIVAGHHFSSGGSKILRGEPSIIANDQTPSIESVLLEILCYCLSTDPHVIKGEILGDNPSPAISTEFDRITHNNLLCPPCS